MKKVVSLVIVLGGLLAFLGWSARDQNFSSDISSKESLEAVVRDDLKKSEEKHHAVSQELLSRENDGELEKLEKRMEDLSHQLISLGFPEVFSDSRLSDEERERLISLVNLQSVLRDQLFKKRSAQIEKRYREKKGML